MASGSRRSRWIAVSVGVVLLGGGTVAWWNSGSGPMTRGISGYDSCPPTAPMPPLPAPEREDAAEHLVPVLPVPVGPVRATLCRYPGDGSGSPIGLELDATRTAEVAGWLDTLLAFEAEVLGCATEDLATVDVVTFGYPEGADATVVIWQGSCLIASNGILTVTDDAELADRLQELVDEA